MQSFRHPSFSGPSSDERPTSIPAYVYRVHRPGAQTRYSFGEGFRAKNQTTIVNYTSGLRRFAMAHLSGATNISSPLISVYDNQAQAERIAHHLSQKNGQETLVVKIDTRHFARGPVFRAADFLKEVEAEMSPGERELHRGEYLIMYKIPPQAIVVETPVGREYGARRMAVGVIGRPVGV
jgi:hypothetical protein